MKTDQIINKVYVELGEYPAQTTKHQEKLRWFEHVSRMTDDGPVKRIYGAKEIRK